MFFSLRECASYILLVQSRLLRMFFGCLLLQGAFFVHCSGWAPTYNCLDCLPQPASWCQPLPAFFSLEFSPGPVVSCGLRHHEISFSTCPWRPCSPVEQPRDEHDEPAMTKRPGLGFWDLQTWRGSLPVHVCIDQDGSDSPEWSDLLEGSAGTCGPDMPRRLRWEAPLIDATRRVKQRKGCESCSAHDVRPFPDVKKQLWSWPPEQNPKRVACWFLYVSINAATV